MRSLARSERAQAAMEYITTYGWAVLVIGIVMFILYQQGILSPYFLTPRAPTGSCFVFKPGGPGSVQDISLSGGCTNEIPQYTAVFNGQNAYARMGTSTSLSPETGTKGKMSLCVWYQVVSLTNYRGPLLKGVTLPSYGNGWEYTLDQNGGAQGFTVWTSTGANIATYLSASQPATGRWFFSCFTYDYAASSAYYYLNSVRYAATFTAGTPATATTGNLVIGSGEGGGSYSNVEAADLQLYNTSLGANDIYTLYKEGIGGAPLLLQNLVAWWPLNGDTNDYSGNGHNATPSNMMFTGVWTNGYTSP